MAKRKYPLFILGIVLMCALLLSGCQEAGDETPGTQNTTVSTPAATTTTALQTSTTAPLQSTTEATTAQTEPTQLKLPFSERAIVKMEKTERGYYIFHKSAGGFDSLCNLCFIETESGNVLKPNIERDYHIDSYAHMRTGVIIYVRPWSEGDDAGMPEKAFMFENLTSQLAVSEVPAFMPIGVNGYIIQSLTGSEPSLLKVESNYDALFLYFTRTTGSQFAAPVPRTHFEYDETTNTLVVMMDLPLELQPQIGDLKLSNTFVNSASLENADSAVKLVLKLSEHTKLYRCEVDEVYYPQNSESMFDHIPRLTIRFDYERIDEAVTNASELITFG